MIIITTYVTGVNDITHRHDVIECVAFNNDGTVWSATDYVFILCHNAAGIGIKGPIKWVAARVTLSVIVSLCNRNISPVGNHSAD